MPYELNLWLFENESVLWKKDNSSMGSTWQWVVVKSSWSSLSRIQLVVPWHTVCEYLCDCMWLYVFLCVCLWWCVCVCLWVHLCDCVCVHLKRSSGKWWLLGGGTSVAILMVTTVSTSLPPSFASPKSTLVSSHYNVSIFESKFNEIKVSVFRGEIHTDYCCWYWYCITILVRT